MSATGPVGGYLLEHLREVGAKLLEEEVPVESEARKVLGAVVKRLEAVEVYLSSQASSRASESSSSPASPAEPPAAAPEPEPVSGTEQPEQPTPEPPPAPPTEAAVTGGAPTEATPEVFTPRSEA